MPYLCALVKRFQYMISKRNKEIFSFFGTTEVQGRRVDIDDNVTTPQLFYKHMNGKIWIII
jgi:hypothetical protein